MFGCTPAKIHTQHKVNIMKCYATVVHLQKWRILGWILLFWATKRCFFRLSFYPENAPFSYSTRLIACLRDIPHDVIESSLYFEMLGVLDFEVIMSLCYAVLLILSKTIAPHWTFSGCQSLHGLCMRYLCQNSLWTVSIRTKMEIIWLWNFIGLLSNAV